MAFFKVRVDDTTYEIDKLTLGEARILKRDFGLTDLQFFSPSDPDQLVGLLFLALRRARPGASDAEVLREVEAIDIEAFAEDGDEEGEDPTPAAVEDDSAATAGSGKSGKPPKTTGPRS